MDPEWRCIPYWTWRYSIAMVWYPPVPCFLNWGLFNQRRIFTLKFGWRDFSRWFAKFDSSFGSFFFEPFVGEFNQQKLAKLNDVDMFLLVSIMDPWTKQTHQLPTELSLKISPPTKSEKNHLQGKWWTLGSSLTSLSGERGIHWKIWTHCRTIFFRTSNQKKWGALLVYHLTCRNGHVKIVEPFEEWEDAFLSHDF